MSTLNYQSLWIEKYRPKKLDDIILDPSIKTKILEWKEAGEIPHLLFCSPPGQGKTSLAKIIVNEVLDCQYLYINASDENGIETIRTSVSGFAQTKSIDGKIKVIILDECDGLTAASQSALRNIIETFSDSCRFILTANFRHKITSALQSRCQRFDVAPTLRESIVHCFKILKLENIKLSASDQQIVVELVRRSFPDLRRSINDLQKSVVGTSIVVKTSEIDNTFFAEIVEGLKDKQAIRVRKFVIESEVSFNTDYPFFLKGLLDYIFNAELKEQEKKCSAVCIAEHLYRSAFVADQEINAFSCICQLEDILS